MTRMARWTGVTCALGGLALVVGPPGGASGGRAPDGANLTVGWDAASGTLEIDGPLVRRPPAELADRVRVLSARAPTDDRSFPPVAGTLNASGAHLRFVPRYALAAGESFVVVVADGRGGSTRSAPITIPEPGPAEPTRVVGVWPTSRTLPENQLKIYVAFSAPMRVWDPYDHVTLRDATTGEVVEHAFQALRDGLWNPSGTRLTLVFDPGRVKRGLTTNARLGPPLRAGRAYRLELAGSWPDATGRPLAEAHTIGFEVGPSDRDRPDPARWVVSAPAVGSLEPVVLDFGEPMDRALLGSLVTLRAETGVPPRHTVEIGKAERSWRALPASPWTAGGYRLLVDCRVEDLAGNNVERLFDVDLRADGPMPESPDGDCAVSVPFTVDGAPG